MDQRRIFKKYMIRYFVVIFLVILCCIPFGMLTWRYIREYTISKHISQLERQVQELDNQVEKMHMIATMIGEEEHLLGLAGIQGEIPDNKQLYLKYVKERLFEIHSIYDFAPMSFILFKNNPAFISASQVDRQWDDYYGHFLSVGDWSGEEFKRRLEEAWRDSPYLAVDDLRYYNSQVEIHLEQGILYLEPLTAGNRTFSGNSLMVFILDGKKVFELLLAEEYQEQALILITDRTGKEVIGYGEDARALSCLREMGGDAAWAGNAEVNEIQGAQETYHVLCFKGEESGLVVTVGYPMSNVYEQLKAIVKLLFLYVLFGCLGAVVMTFLCTWHWFKPVRRILDEIARLGDIPVGKGNADNEYDYIREAILSMVSAKDEMEMKMLFADAQKQAIMLENIFIRGFSGPEEREDFKKRFPYHGEGYYVVIFRALPVLGEKEKEPENQTLLYAMELFEQQHGGNMIQIYPESNMAVAMAASSGLDDEGMKSMLTLISDMVCRRYEVRLIVGISRKQEELDHINVAFAQARQTVRAYYNREKSSVEFYQMLYDGQRSCFHVDVLRKLYDLTLCSDRQGVEKLFAELSRESQASPERYEFQKQEVYYTIQFILHSVCQQMAIPIEEDMHASVELQQIDLQECLDILYKQVLKACDLVDGRKASRSEERKAQLLEYLNMNFTRPELNADIVGRELELSEKYIYAFLREHTGRTFSACLEELRIEYARKCLEQTDWSNEKIAQESGFGSANTFYRIFKKRIGVSPNAYRKRDNLK